MRSPTQLTKNAPRDPFAAGGVSWKETQLITALDSPGCQSPITGMYGGAGVLLTSPVGKTRANLHVFHASSSSGLTDWKSLGTLWAAQAGYSSLLAGRSLLPRGERAPQRVSSRAGAAELGDDDGGDDDDYLVLFEGGFTSSFQYTMLIRFTVDTAE
eukprot:COSAG01_NODE_4160_length_5287_cov_12.643986_7_plen_157_part_00